MDVSVSDKTQDRGQRYFVLLSVPCVKFRDRSLSLTTPVHPQTISSGKISGCHGGGYEDVAPCSPVEVDRCFRGAIIRTMMIALLMETVCTSKTSVNFYETTRCNIPDGCHLQCHSALNIL
jgi:hypothetical protein